MIDWKNKGVQPSTEKQNTGYLAYEKIPAGHMNWFINQLGVMQSNLSTLPTQIVFGVYTEDGTTSQHIELGFRPAAVIVFGAIGQSGYGSSFANYAALDGYPAIDDNETKVEVTDGGFNALSSNIGTQHIYIAFSNYTEME